MLASNKQMDKSRLGRLLVNRGYITDRQLEYALIAQRNAGLMLGEYLIQQGIITQKDLERTLKHQTRYRYTAAFVAMVVTPLQPMVAFAASNTANANSRLVASEQLQNFSSKHGMQPLTDDAMSDVAAQGIKEDIASIMGSANKSENPGSLKVIKTFSEVLMPITGMLAYDSKVEGVTYDMSKPVFQVHNDGSMEMALPKHIDKISLENLRVAGSNPNSKANFGSVYISDISFDPSSKVVITVH
jgi:hypothetical protein